MLLFVSGGNVDTCTFDCRVRSVMMNVFSLKEMHSSWRKYKMTMLCIFWGMMGDDGCGRMRVIPFCLLFA